MPDDPLGGWTAVPVDHDPFASVPDSTVTRHGFQEGGELDDDGVARGATGEPNAQSAASAPAGGPQLERPGDGRRASGLLPPSGEASSAPDLSAEEVRAAAAAGNYKPVVGLPQKAIPFSDGSHYIPGPLEKAHQAAEAYMAESGLPYDPPRDYAKINPEFARRVAQAFEDMPHAPDDPAVRSAYDALARETMAQWQHVKNTGLKVDWITPETGDPYADNPRQAIKDVRDNNHWWGYPTDLGYGSGDEVGAAAENPMLADSGEEVGGRRAVVNDIFRIVHDYFGHAKEGHGFRAEGEDNAFRSHAAMYSDAAKPAMTSELRGQNSWLNYGPHGEHNRTAKAADTIFADQKIGVMPPWSYREGMSGGMGTPLMAPQLVGRPATSLVGEEEHLRRQRQGLEPPGGRPVEWTGGRISFADGGATDPLGYSVTMGHPQLEPIDHDPFPPESTVQPSDVARAKGFPEPRSPMHDRIAAAAQDEPETLAHYAGNPEHWMPMRIGAAIGEEGRRIGQGLWSAATLPGDIATGKTTMEDPEAQQRAISLAASLPGGGPEAALGARGPVGAVSRAVRGASERELNRWNAETGQWEGPKPTLNPPKGAPSYKPLFNFDPAVMNKVPDVPQFDLPRYEPPRGVSDRVRDLVANPDVRQKMLELIKNGMQTVGMSWYNTGQLRGMFLKELGEKKGQQAFEQYMQLVSATSPENKIPQNARTASYYYWRQQQGMEPMAKGDPIAQPYGAKVQKLHQQNVADVLTHGYDVLKNPKPPSFVQNLMGNYAPGTMDRHAFKLPAMLSRDPRFLETSFKPKEDIGSSVYPQRMYASGQLKIEDAVNQPTMWSSMPNKNEYGALEGYYKSLADELGITPAQAQASAWVGGGHITGLGSPPSDTFLHSFQGRVFNTAHHTGMTPARVVKGMIRGEFPLLSGGPGIPPLLQQEQARKEAQTLTAEAGGSLLPPAGPGRE